MAITNDSYYKYQESRAQSGYKAAILVREPSSNYYSLLVASETVPSVFSTQDSFEFDLLNSPVKGKISGKISLDDKEVEVLHHRDNVLRFHKLKDQVLDFMYVDSQFVGYKFSGKLSYRANDATADVLRGTYTITPMSADPDPIFNVRDYIQETICFTSPIPDTVKTGEYVQISTSVDGASLTVYDMDENGNLSASENATISVGNSFMSTSSGLFAIEASHNDYAPWTTTIYVE